MRKRKQWKKSADLSDQLREEQEIAEAKKQQMVVEGQRQRACLKRFVEQEKEKEQHIQHADKGLFSEWNPWFVLCTYKGFQAE